MKVEKVSGKAKKNKEQEMENFRNPIEQLIGLYCVKAYDGYAGHLKLSFSRNNRRINRFENDGQKAEWVFETISSAWRLLTDNNFLAGSYEDDEYNDKELECLIGLKLTSAIFSNKTDLTLHFENGYKLETFNHANTFPVLEIYSDTDYSLESHSILLETGNWEKEKENEGLTNIEEIENEHSEKCYNRWTAKAPSETFDNNCRECAYFLPISGRFYFWDFGLCCNEKSSFDGKVVGVKTSCEHFDTEIIIENKSPNR